MSDPKIPCLTSFPPIVDHTLISNSTIPPEIRTATTESGNLASLYLSHLSKLRRIITCRAFLKCARFRSIRQNSVRTPWSKYTAFVATDESEVTKGKYGVSVSVPVLVPDGVLYETAVQG